MANQEIVAIIAPDRLLGGYLVEAMQAAGVTPVVVSSNPGKFGARHMVAVDFGNSRQVAHLPECLVGRGVTGVVSLVQSTGVGQMNSHVTDVLVAFMPPETRVTQVCTSVGVHDLESKGAGQVNTIEVRGRVSPVNAPRVAQEITALHLSPTAAEREYVVGLDKTVA